MSQNTLHKITGNTSANIAGAQETVRQNDNNDVSPPNDANQAIAQCLLLAARRGRQIRLAREQAAQQPQTD